MKRRFDLRARAKDERKMFALIAYEPTQDSEVLADTVENDGSGFWNPNLYICVPKSMCPKIRSDLIGNVNDDSRAGTVVLITHWMAMSPDRRQNHDNFLSACQDLPRVYSLYLRLDVD